MAEIEKHIKPNTKLLYLETPANPTIQLTDIEAACKLAHKHGITVCVDNTFSSPYLQRPLEHGADIVIHSLTKFLNGHSDVVGGMIVTKNEELYQNIEENRPQLKLEFNVRLTVFHLQNSDIQNILKVKIF